ncbi:hypothetical protein ACN47E_007914 [Coniothyrium glycines]
MSLSATYASPDTPSKTFSCPLPTLASTPSTSDRTAYLAALQSSLKDVQKDINAFLTEKMEQDKATGSSKDSDAKDEETYGEELAEED